MSRELIQKWSREPKESVLSKIGNRLHPEGSIKERIGLAIYRLKAQLSKLESAYDRMQSRSKEFFDKCVKARMERDDMRATMYATECAEVRKLAKVTLQCQLALEQVTLRLETIQALGDVAAMVVPIASVVGSVKSYIQGIVPEVGVELSEIGEILNGVVLEVGEVTGYVHSVEASDEEAQRILNEAGLIAEQRMRERFPELPMAGLTTEKVSRQGAYAKT